MPDKNGPQTEIAAAKVDAVSAQDADAAASLSTLNRLRGLSISKRFEAFGDDTIKLTLEDRRTLLQELKQGAPARRPIPATTAGHWALFRARLPYRVVPLTLSALVLVTTIVVVFIARARTPEYWVRSRYAQDIAAEFRATDGKLLAHSLVAGRRYALISQDDTMATLQLWVPRVGYAMATVPRNWIEQAP